MDDRCDGHEPEYESFAITSVSPDGTMQGRTMDGEVREFALVVNREVGSGELTLGVARHYVDPDSLAAFAGSEAWDARTVEA